MTQDAHAGHGDCSEVLHRIYEYLDGEMSADDVRRVAAHLNECQPCLAEHDLDVALKQVVRLSPSRAHRQRPHMRTPGTPRGLPGVTSYVRAQALGLRPWLALLPLRERRLRARLLMGCLSSGTCA